MQAVFNDIKPRTRAERVSALYFLICFYQVAMKDRERIEIRRLEDRTGGYHKYVDSANIHNPDPISTHFVSGKQTFHNLNFIYTESERFDKDFAVAD
jgi:hypothetical protein